MQALNESTESQSDTFLREANAVRSRFVRLHEMEPRTVIIRACWKPDVRRRVTGAASTPCVKRKRARLMPRPSCLFVR